MSRIITFGFCELCGGTQRVAYSLVRWKAAEGRAAIFDNLPRCVDRASCRTRVEAKGQEWLVDDRPPDPP